MSASKLRRTNQENPTALALFGGEPVVAVPPPHVDLLRFTAADRDALAAFLGDPNAPNSYFGREGELQAYEAELGEFFAASDVVLTNSGTSALYSAFFAAGVGPGDEVIGPAYTFHATVTPVLQLGGAPVLVDVDPTTGNIDPAKVEAAITSRTRAIIATHQWGHPVDGPRLRAIADRHGVVLIEDVSLAIGATLDGKRAGMFGHVAAFSLGSTKMFSGGQGGALVTSNPAMADRANLLGHFGRRSLQAVHDAKLKSFAPTGYGHNFRMHPLAVSISRARFSRREELIAARQARFDRLSNWLSQTEGVLNPPVTSPNASRGSWQGYCARYDARGTGVPLDYFARALRAEGLEVAPRGYQPCLHELRIFAAVPKDLGRRSEARRLYAPGDFPVAEAHVAALIGFPIFLDEPFALVDAYGRACLKVARHLEALTTPRSRP